MAEQERQLERQGRPWTLSKVRWEEAEDADFRFWYEGLTPEERVAAVERIQKLSAGLSLGGLKIKDLISEGRR